MTPWQNRVTALTQRMADDMKLRNYSQKTIDTYTYHVGRFAQHIGKSLEQAVPEDVRSFQLHLIEERKVGWSSFNQAVCGLRFLFRTTYPRSWAVSMVPFGKKPKTLPTVLGGEEVTSLLSCVKSLKHRTFLLTLYAAGLRLNEAAELTIADIDSQRMQLRIAHGKGAKERLVPLCPTSDYAMEIREDVAFFQIVQTMFRKYSTSGRTGAELDLAIRQLVSKAVVTAQDDVIDVYQAAGIDRPDVSMLSEEFLEEVRRLPHKNLAVELLKKLLSDEIKTRNKRNVVQAKAFSELLQNAMNSHHNRAISNQEIIEELIQIAHKLKEASDRGEDLGLTEDEVCFYDALAQNDSATEMLGDDKLKVIATQLVMTVRKNVSIDWTVRESARAKIRVVVRRILKKLPRQQNWWASSC